MEKFFVIVIAVAVVTAIVGLIYQRPKLLKSKLQALLDEVMELPTKEKGDTDRKALVSMKKEAESCVEDLKSLIDIRLLRWLNRNIQFLFKLSEKDSRSRRFQRKMRKLLPKILGCTAESSVFEKLEKILKKISTDTYSNAYTQLGIACDELEKIQLTVHKVSWKSIRTTKKKLELLLNYYVPCRREFSRVPNAEERFRRIEESRTNCTTCMSGQCPFNANPYSDCEKRQPK